MQEAIFKAITVKEVAKKYMYSFIVFTLKMASCMCKPNV